MLIHERFIFIHNQKCGGTFVRTLLKRELGEESLRARSHQHGGWDRIPAAAEGLPVLCYVRNPWDWYVSWYEFKLQDPTPTGPLFTEISNNGRHDFAQTIRNACSLKHPIAGATDACTASFLHSVGAGLNSENLTVGRFESLVDDLDRFLSWVGVELPDDAIARAHATDPINATKRRHYREYFDEELRDLVGESSRLLIDRFGYEFEQEPS